MTAVLFASKHWQRSFIPTSNVDVYVLLVLPPMSTAALLQWSTRDTCPVDCCWCGGCRNATRGDRRLFVSSTAQFSANAWVRLLLDNVNNGLLADLHSNLIPADVQFNNKQDVVQFNFKITEVN